MDEYDFEKLAREIVASRLSEIQEAPHAAGEIAKKIIIAGVQSTKVRQDPHKTVTAVCRGVIGGMLLLNKSLPETAVMVLNEMVPISHEVHLDPGDLMTWSMEGIADVCRMSGLEVRHSVQTAIEESFMGAGEAFSAICVKGDAKPAGN